MKIRRRALLGGAASVLVARQAEAFLFRGGASAGAATTLLTTRTVANTTTSTVASVQPIRFGLPLPQGAVPSGSSLVLKDGAANALSFQADARSTWPDGSLKFAEILALTARTVAGGKACTASTSGTTATIAATSHGITGGDTVFIDGLNTLGYNGNYVLAAPTSGTLTYTLPFALGAGTGGVVAAVSNGAADTISVYATGGAFNNTLPAGKTAANIISDLTSFTGANDLKVVLTGIGSCSGASNSYTTGTWTASLNTALGGSNVQQTNKGPNCMGFKAWIAFNNGSIDHVHLFADWYVWIWLNPSTGAITGVEYMVGMHNGPRLMAGGVPAPDRYNYVATVQNGASSIAAYTVPHGGPHLGISTLTNSTTTATVTTASAHGLNTDDYVIIDGVTVSSGTNYWNQVSAKITKTGASTFTYVMAGTPGPVASLAAATSGGLGGHHAWSRWFTAGTDGKTRWVGSLGPTALTVVMDTAAKNYFMSSSQTPKYDTTLIPAAQLSAITYPGAMDKGPLLDGSGNGSTHGGYPAPYYSHIAFDSGGNDLWFGVHPNWSVTAFLAQSNDQFKLDRIGSIGFGTYPFQILEQNGRITALVAGTYTGLVQDTLSFFTDAFFAPANNNITLYTEAPTSSNDVALYLVGAGNYEGSSGSAGVRNTTHIGSHSHLIYLQEGYRHHLDMLIMRANGGVLCKTVGPGAVPGKIDIYTIRVQNSTVTPGLSGSYDGICMASTLAPREEAWALNPLFQAASICPDNLADGTAFVEKAYFQQIVSQNAAFAADMVTNVLDTNAKALGVWQFQPGIGGDDPWMQSYIGWAVGNGYLATAGESYQSNWATFINHHMKYFIGMGTKPAWMFGVQTINTKTNMTGPFQPNWASIGYYIVDSGGNYTEFWVIDGTTGWLTFSTPAEMPTGFTLNLNDQVMFTNDCFGSCGATLPTSGTDSIGNPVVISPGDTFYYIAVIDVPNTRVKISTTPGGNPIVAYNVSVAIPTPYLMPTLIAPPSTGCMSFQNAGSHLNDCLMAIRSYLKAGFDNGGGDLATTNTAVSVQSATLNYSSQMGTFNEQPRQRFLL